MTDCEDCGLDLMPRGDVRRRAAGLAASIGTENYSPDQRAAFACFALLLVGELSVRCERCANRRLMRGVSTIACSTERH